MSTDPKAVLQEFERLLGADPVRIEITTRTMFSQQDASLTTSPVVTIYRRTGTDSRGNERWKAVSPVLLPEEGLDTDAARLQLLDMLVSLAEQHFGIDRITTGRQTVAELGAMLERRATEQETEGKRLTGNHNGHAAEAYTRSFSARAARQGLRDAVDTVQQIAPLEQVDDRADE